MKTYNYGKQHLELDDYIAVLKTLASPFLTCGPKVKEFERAICDYTGAKYCVAVNSATSGLHIANLATGIGADDEVITSPITFLSSANCARFVGANVRFADIVAETANINPVEIKKHITPKTKAIIPVHFAGQSCDMEAINLVQDNLRQNKGVLSYDTHYEKQVYDSFPNLKRRNFVQFYYIFLLRLHL